MDHLTGVRRNNMRTDDATIIGQNFCHADFIIIGYRTVQLVYANWYTSPFANLLHCSTLMPTCATSGSV